MNEIDITASIRLNQLLVEIGEILTKMAKENEKVEFKVGHFGVYRNFGDYVILYNDGNIVAVIITANTANTYRIYWSELENYLCKYRIVDIVQALELIRYRLKGELGE